MFHVSQYERGTLAMTMNNYRKNILIDVRTKGNVPVIRPHGVHLDKMSTSDKTPIRSQ